MRLIISVGGNGVHQAARPKLNPAYGYLAGCQTGGEEKNSLKANYVLYIVGPQYNKTKKQPQSDSCRLVIVIVWIGLFIIIFFELLFQQFLLEFMVIR